MSNQPRPVHLFFPQPLLKVIGIILSKNTFIFNSLLRNLLKMEVFYYGKKK